MKAIVRIEIEVEAPSVADIDDMAALDLAWKALGVEGGDPQRGEATVEIIELPNVLPPPVGSCYSQQHETGQACGKPRYHPGPHSWEEA